LPFWRRKSLVDELAEKIEVALGTNVAVVKCFCGRELKVNTDANDLSIVMVLQNHFYYCLDENVRNKNEVAYELAVRVLRMLKGDRPC